MTLLLIICSVSASEDYSIGFERTEVVSKETSEKFPLAFVYPSSTPSKPVSFGPFEMELSMDGEIAEGSFPLAIISHGSGGSDIGHRSIAFDLVKRGFIVGMPLHPKNNYKNNSAEGTAENWVHRPKHIKASIDALLSNSKLSSSIDTENIAVVGHSAGGYTALAVAGGVADTAHTVELCTKNRALNDGFCSLAKNTDVKLEKIIAARDERIKALVLMAPVGILFRSKDALALVDIPVLLLRAEKDQVLVEPYHSEIIAENIEKRGKLTYRTIENAGHYSFITPFPEILKSQLGVVAEDPEGFDRGVFHQSLGEEIADYLLTVLE